jgi:hypothetical protein
MHMKLVMLNLLQFSSFECFLLMRQRRVTADSGLSTDLRTTAEYVRCAASGAACNGLGTTIKYLRRTSNGTAGNDLGTTIKFL